MGQTGHPALTKSSWTSVCEVHTVLLPLIFRDNGLTSSSFRVTTVRLLSM